MEEITGEGTESGREDTGRKKTEKISKRDEEEKGEEVYVWSLLL